jgi:hypothetical protein
MFMHIHFSEHALSLHVSSLFSLSFLKIFYLFGLLLFFSFPFSCSGIFFILFIHVLAVWIWFALPLFALDFMLSRRWLLASFGLFSHLFFPQFALSVSILGPYFCFAFLLLGSFWIFFSGMYSFY